MTSRAATDDITDDITHTFVLLVGVWKGEFSVWGPAWWERQLGGLVKKLPPTSGAFRLKFVTWNSEIPTCEHKRSAALMFVAGGVKTSPN